MRVAKRLSVMGLGLMLAVAASESSRGDGAPPPVTGSPPRSERPAFGNAQPRPDARGPRALPPLTGRAGDAPAQRAAAPPVVSLDTTSAAGSRSRRQAASPASAPAAHRATATGAADGQERLLVGDLDAARAEDLLATERPAAGPLESTAP